MTAATVIPASSDAGVLRRAAVTGAGIAALLVSERLHLPFIDDDSFRQLFGKIGLLSVLTAGSLRSLSWDALGLQPFFAGFLLVEVITVAVPGLRGLRHGPARQRARLTRAAWLVSLAFAAVQAWGLAVWISGVRDTFGQPLVPPSFLPVLGVAAGAFLGTVALGGAAVLVSRYGLGNGFALLFGVGALQFVLVTVVEAFSVPRGMWTETGALLMFAALVLPVVLAARPRGSSGPRIPVPTCSLWILEGPPVILGFPAKFALWLPAAVPFAEWLHRTLRSDHAYAIVAIALTGTLAFAFSRAFCPRASVVHAYEAAAPEPLDVGATMAVRRALRSANARSLALALGVSAFPAVASGVGVPVVIPIGSLLSVFIFAAVSQDVWEEAAARARCGVLASAWQVHRVYAVEPVLAALSRAGIPAHARTRHYRALFHVFAPYAPLEILVPVERVADAEVTCARVVA